MDIYFHKGNGMLDAFSEMRISLIRVELLPKNQAFVLLDCFLRKASLGCKYRGCFLNKTMILNTIKSLLFSFNLANCYKTNTHREMLLMSNLEDIDDI